MVGDPLTGDQAGHQGLIQSSGMPIVDIFDRGRLAEFGRAQPRFEPAIVPFGEFAVHEQAKAFLES